MILITYHIQVMLWFTLDPDSTETFNRVARLKSVLFDVFADYSGPIPLLDYVEFVSMACKYYLIHVIYEILDKHFAIVMIPYLLSDKAQCCMDSHRK